MAVKSTKKSPHKTSPKKGGEVKLSFKAQAVTKRLLAALPDRARDVLIKRYGLGDTPKKMTLEAIGQIYGITRERVRQIENYGLSTIRKSDAYEKERTAFEELEGSLLSLGTVIPELELLRLVARDESTQNHVHFLLVLGHRFSYERESADFVHHWHVDTAQAEGIKKALRALYENLSDEDLVPESQFISMFLDMVKDTSEHYRDEEIARRWLSLSKRVGKNPLGEWGRAESSGVNLKGVRDLAYLVIRSHGSPMHFTEVARRIGDLFDKKAHIATTHNELIKDNRFVLVGRGLYALTEWGYMQGVVKDVIREILRESGPMTREEIVERVLKERYVKPNTIAVNLQDSKIFKRNSDGTYNVVSRK